MQFIDQSDLSPNKVWIDDDGTLNLKVYGIHTTERDDIVHQALLKAAAIIKESGQSVRLLVDMTELEGSSAGGRRAAFLGLIDLDPDYAGFGGARNVMEAGLIRMTAKLMSRGVYRYFDGAPTARHWLDSRPKTAKKSAKSAKM
jgi:hypothetical protein